MTSPPNPLEFEILAKLSGLIENENNPSEVDSNLKVSIGDDAAVLDIGGSLVAISTDALVNGVHFNLDYFSVADLAHKALAVNASDIAAMGAKVRYFLATVTTPKTPYTSELLSCLHYGARELDAILIGGDLSSNSNLTISITAIGIFGPGTTPMLRSNALPGDFIMASGPLGGSNFGLRCLIVDPDSSSSPQAKSHLRPTPQIKLGPLLCKAGVRCAIDVSDGLLGDLEHIARASNVGTHLTNIPIFNGANLNDALYGGEDYQLIFTTADPESIDVMCDEAEIKRPVVIGKCTSNSSERTLFGQPYEPHGYSHDI